MDSESLEYFMRKLKLSISSILLAASLNTACYQEIDDNEAKKTPARKTSTPANASPTNNSAANNSNNSSVSSENSNNSNNQMTQNGTTEPKGNGFNGNLPSGFVQPTDSVGKLLLREYGAVFLARGGATPPTSVIFKDEAAVSAFQSSLTKSSEKIGAHTLELQSAAMTGLKSAIAEAKQSNQTITPRGADSAKRTYSETVTLWNSRVEPGLKHWVSKGKLSQSEASRIKSLSTFEQVTEVLKLEEQKMFFAKSLDKSIIFSVAPPGTSQHLSLLALDINENGNAQVREILAKHGWFQTVVSDLPHFTFLGVKETDLPALGLKKESAGGRIYWVPDI